MLSAYWELYLHALFVHLGLRAEPEPPISSTTRRGDLLLRSNDDRVFLEATVNVDPQADSADRRRRQAVYDALDRMDSPNFFLGLEIEASDPVMPALGSVRAGVERWLRTLDPDDVQSAFERADSKDWASRWPCEEVWKARKRA